MASARIAFAIRSCSARDELARASPAGREDFAAAAADADTTMMDPGF
jgi:hypothetical protein